MPIHKQLPSLLSIRVPYWEIFCTIWHHYVPENLSYSWQNVCMEISLPSPRPSLVARTVVFGDLESDNILVPLLWVCVIIGFRHSFFNCNYRTLICKKNERTSQLLSISCFVIDCTVSPAGNISLIIDNSS